MKKYLSCLILCIILFAGCSKNDCPVCSTKTGNIMGRVELHDEDVNLIGNNSGVTVTLKGTNYSSQTDSSGNWLLKDVPAGIYDVIFSKPGYDTLFVFGYQFIGNGTDLCSPQGQTSWDTYYCTGNNNAISDYTNNWVLKQPRSEVFSDLVIASDFEQDSVYGDAFYCLKMELKTTKYVNETIFLSTNPNLSKYSYQDCLTNQWGSYDSTTKVFKIYAFKKNHFDKFKSGETVYIKIYPGYGSYEKDLRDGFIHWIGLGKSTVQGSFVMP
jgi:hypothetical protein